VPRYAGSAGQPSASTRRGRRSRSSIWIDGRTLGPAAVQKARDEVDVVREAVRAHAEDLALARTADDVRRAHGDEKIAMPMGVEGGHMIGNELRMVRVLGDLGVRYLTLPRKPPCRRPSDVCRRQ